MSQCVRYFADGVVTLKAISAGLVSFDPAFKIDGGELLRGTELLGEIEICSAGSDLFAEDLAYNIGMCERISSPNAQQVVMRLRNARSIITIRVIDGERDPDVTWDLMSPLWTVLPSQSLGLTQMDGHGFYDGSTLVVAIG